MRCARQAFDPPSRQIAATGGILHAQRALAAGSGTAGESVLPGRRVAGRAGTGTARHPAVTRPWRATVSCLYGLPFVAPGNDDLVRARRAAVDRAGSGRRAGLE